VENLIVSLVTVGEGWHNFHHTFPSDYRAAEYGQIYDLTTMAIESLQNLGSAYDLRQTPQYLVNKWVKNFGDGNHPLGGEEEVPLATQDTPLSTNKIL
jgi:stearoyl-CoA desaturase (delta-9 desaturase)